jgi:hypothetical protein
MKNSGFTYLFYKILLLIVLYVVALKMPLIYPAGFPKYLRLLIIIIILVESINLFRILFFEGKLKQFENTGVVLISIFITTMTLETVFMFIPKSHVVGYTLGSKLWFNKYWKPINSMGFRDEETNISNPSILFIGDSFTAGHGLKNSEERFSNIVKKELFDKGYNYSVINLGRNGIDTRGEYDLMIDFIKKKNIVTRKVILQYYGNDIEMAAVENGLIFNGFEPYSDIPKYLGYLVKGSYLANFIYWTLPKKDTFSYSKFLENAYKDQKIMADHKKDFKRFIDYCNENSIELIVVVFPFMQNLELSDTIFVNEILKYFEENKIKTINVSQLVENIKLSDRVVNNIDGHASKKVNLLVAKEILKMTKF